MRILTDEGIEGISTYSAGANVDEIKYQLIGEDPLDRERIWQKFWRNLRTSNLGLAIGPVDCALWDLFGKVSNAPVYKLLGGMRDKIPAYASTVTLDSLERVSWPWPTSAWTRATRPSSCTPGDGCRRMPSSAAPCARTWVTTSC